MVNWKKVFGQFTKVGGGELDFRTWVTVKRVSNVEAILNLVMKETRRKRL